MIVHETQTTNYNKMTVFCGKTKVVEIVNPTKQEIKAYNTRYPFASVTVAGTNEIRFYI